MKNLLITGVGGPTPRSFVRAVKFSDNGLSNSIRFVGLDCNPLAYGLYDRSLFDSTYVVPKAGDEAYWPAINKIVKDENIHAAIVQPEKEILEWSLNKNKLKNDIITHLPDHQLAATLVNKYRLHEHLNSSLLIPEYRKIKLSSVNYQSLVKALGTPFWIRSTEGSSGLGSLKIVSESGLRQWLSINEDVEEFIATEYLPGRNMACKMLYFGGDLKRTACAERVNYVMAKVAPSGVTGNTSFGRLINEPQLVELSEEALTSIAAELGAGLNGIFTVDFKEDAQGNPKITEINIRHVAFTSSMAKGGANLPMDTIEAMFAADANGFGMKRIDYTYEESFIFLRDVDAEPIVLREADLLRNKSDNP